MTPYILKHRKRLPPETGPDPEHIYDGARQLWIDKASGRPLVSIMAAHAEPTKFGETTLTETREGADKTESAIQASDFGETIQTRTREGTDQIEGNTMLRASNLGETTMTKTREGADQTEVTNLQECDAAYSHF